MKQTILATIAVLLLAISAPALAQPNAKLNPGMELPGADIAMRNVDGKKITMKNCMGANGLLVMFSCNTCPFVIKNQPITRKTMEYAIAHHIGMVIINSNEARRSDDDSYENMKTYAREQGYTVPYLADEHSTVADMFGANHTPEIFLFNSKGILMYKGAMNDNPSDPSGYKVMYVNNAIDAMIGGQNIDPQITKSIGCSIKRKS